METASPLTLNYLTQLSILLSPIPTLSSSTSISLSQHLPNGLPITSRYTKCSKCFTELIGGINSSYRRKNGQGLRFCESCRWVSKIDEEGAKIEGKRGKEIYKRVKRRKVVSTVPAVIEVYKEELIIIKKEISIIPSQVTQPTLPSPSLPSKPVPFSHKTSQLQASFKPPSPSISLPISNQSTPIPSPYSSTTSSRASTPLPSSSKASNSTSIQAVTNTSGNAKRKRSKQPSGLAEMLEAKKKEKLRAEGGLGLNDFLQGM